VTFLQIEKNGLGTERQQRGRSRCPEKKRKEKKSKEF
jgi:hypothetical protein